MIMSLRHVLGWVFRALGSREDLVLENLALRQQLLALHAKRPRRRLLCSSSKRSTRNQELSACLLTYRMMELILYLWTGQ
jgi:hypothetical protein